MGRRTRFKSMNSKVRERAKSRGPKHKKTTKRQTIQKRGEIVYLNDSQISNLIDLWCNTKGLTNHKEVVRHRCAYFLSAMRKGKLRDALESFYNRSVALKNDIDHFTTVPFEHDTIESMFENYINKKTNPRYINVDSMTPSLETAIYNGVDYSSLFYHGIVSPARLREPDPLERETDVDVRMGAEKFLETYEYLKFKKDETSIRRQIWRLSRELISIFRKAEFLTACPFTKEDGDLMLEEYANFLNSSDVKVFPKGLGPFSGWWKSFSREVLHLVEE